MLEHSSLLFLEAAHVVGESARDERPKAEAYAREAVQPERASVAKHSGHLGVALVEAGASVASIPRNDGVESLIGKGQATVRCLDRSDAGWSFQAQCSREVHAHPPASWDLFDEAAGASPELEAALW